MKDLKMYEITTGDGEEWNIIARTFIGAVRMMLEFSFENDFSLLRDENEGIKYARIIPETTYIEVMLCENVTKEMYPGFDVDGDEVGLVGGTVRQWIDYYKEPYPFSSSTWAYC